MQSVVENLLERYNCKTPSEYKNALREIIQEIALLGLSKTDFFSKAAFYGGSALRIFYGLDRFSEDIDFSLLEPVNKFSISKYCKPLEAELGAYGFEMSVQEKVKKGETKIESAFIKGGTLINLLKISSITPPVSGVNSNEVLKIKFEVDINPPEKAHTEIKYNLNPVPYNLRLYTLPSLFAGKIHSILCRKWKIRVKGRDLYDYVWFISRDIPVNLKHLTERLKQTKFIETKKSLDKNELLKLLNSKFEKINYKQASDDIKRFIKNPDRIKIWSEDFFRQITNEKLKTTIDE